MIKSKIGLNTIRNGNADKRKFIMIYSVLFAFVLFFVFYNYIVKGLTFVRWGDGYWQHYTCLEYYGKWLRSIIYTLFNEHRLVIPAWDFSIGLGSDVLTTFNYYTIGDPLTLLSVIVPVKYTPYLFCFLGVLRHYLTGLFFALFCFERKHKDIVGITLSAFVYTFGCFAISVTTKHPYFVNAMIYLPIILICVERIFKNKNPIYLALIVCVAEVSNFYFFYVLVIATVVYVLLRLFELYKKDIKAMIAPLFKIALSSVIGVISGGAVFVPVIYRLFSDSRTSVENSYPIFHSLEYYLRLPGALVTYSYCGVSTILGYSIIVVFALVALFVLKKKSISLKLSLIICILGFMTPLFASFANGFSYPTNRWLFVFSFVVSFAVSEIWEEMFTADKKKTVIVAVIPLIYALLCFLTDCTERKNMLISTAFIVVISAVILVNRFLLGDKGKCKRFVSIAVAAVSIISIIVNAQFAFSNLGKYYSVNEIRNFASEDAVAVNEQIKLNPVDEFFRYTGDYLAVNDNVRKGLSNTQHYWSFSNAAISDFQDSVKLNEPYYQWVNGFDEIASINTLSSVRYYYDSQINKNTNIPFGYVETETENLYENKYYLPIGYTYDSYVTREYFDSLSTSLDKQQSMLQGVVLEEETDHCKSITADLETNKVDSKMIIKSKDVTLSGNTFTVTKDDAIVYFAVRPQKNSELYISLNDISYEGIKPYSIYTDDTDADPKNIYDTDDFHALDIEEQERIIEESKYFIQEDEIELKVGVLNSDKELVSAKKVIYFTPEFDFYCGKTSFDANLGYSEDGYSYVAIRFPYIGKYTFGDIAFYAQPMDSYAERVSKLGAEALQNAVFENNTLKGNITVSSDKILCLSIPYSKGWTAYVDGEETELVKANVMYMALEISEGEHNIELRYSTPALKAGIAASICGLILIFAYGMWYHIKRKKNLIEFKEKD